MIKAQYASDEALVEALKIGDRSALHYLYKTYWPMALKLIVQNNGMEDDAKELYQETIIHLYEKCKSENLTLTSSLKTYIYAVCRNKWLNVLRSKRKVVDIASFGEELENDSSENEITDTRQKKVVDTILTMGDPCQSLLIGYYYDKLSFELLAKRMNYQSPNVAKQQKFRCIERLKKLFSATTLA